MALAKQLQKQYTVPRGRVSVSEFRNDDPRQLEGLRYIGNTPAFDITFSAESLEHEDADGGFAEIDDETILKISEEGTLNTDNMNGDNLAMFFLGAANLHKQIATNTPVEELIGPVSTDMSYPVGLNIVGGLVQRPQGLRGLTEFTAFAVAQDGSKGAALSAGTDYVVQEDIGQITILSGGTLAAGAMIMVSYKLLDTEQVQVVSQRHQREGRLQFIANNPKGKNYDFMFPRVRFMPDGSFDLKNREWLNMSIKFRILSPGYGMESIYIDGRPEVVIADSTG